MAARRVHVQAARRSSRPSPLTYGRRRPVSPSNRQAASGHTNMGGGWPSRPSPVAFTVSFGRKGRLKPFAACAHLSATPAALTAPYAVLCATPSRKAHATAYHHMHTGKAPRRHSHRRCGQRAVPTRSGEAPLAPLVNHPKRASTWYQDEHICGDIDIGSLGNSAGSHAPAVARHDAWRGLA
jgi:hypothetical protein